MRRGRNSGNMATNPQPFAGGLPSSLRDLLRLLGHAHGACRRLLALAIAATALAAVADVASLALLQRAAIVLLPASGAPSGSAAGALTAFLGAALAGSVIRYWAQRRTVLAQYAVVEALSVEAFALLQHQDYSEYLEHGASEGFAAFERLQMVSFNGLAPLIAGTAALLSATAMLAALIVLYPAAALLVAAIPAALVLSALLGRERGWATGLSELIRRRARLVSEARQAFRDIFLINGQARVSADFAEIEGAARRRQAAMILSAQSSRHGFEVAVLALILVALLRFPPSTAENWRLLPALGVLALAALRVLPQLATLRSAARQISLHGDVIGDVLALFERGAQRVAPPGAPLHFSRELVLEGVTVKRADRPDTLRGLDLTVPAATRVGIIGASGAGKSTLLDTICGALAPHAGAVLVDGIAITPANGPAWRERIGIVSQDAKLFGRTLAEAVSYPDHPDAVDRARFAAAVEGAGVVAMVRDFARGLDTEVGEALARLSGGQRQRLALAHALYRARDLLILDEATGQLDAESEQGLIAAIDALPATLTVIVVTHRPALLACCRVTYRLVGGRLVAISPEASPPD